MRRRAVRIVLFAFALAAVGFAAAGVWVWRDFTAPGPSAEIRTIVIPKGTGLRALAHRLADAGVVRRPLVFVAGVRAIDLARRMHAGEFAFAPGMSMEAVARHIASGETVRRRLTVPEGLTVREIVGLVAAADGLDGDVGAVPAEGSLLPETYFFSYGDARTGIVARMRDGMKQAVSDSWAKRNASAIAISTPAEALVLASIIEKETGIAAERPRISGVFHNRLRKGMRLQSDPTVVYALTQGGAPLGRALSRADLGIESPYNTYQTGGLPPGPIASPGRAALDAAVRPMQTDELYFVADGTGGHVFARTLAEHNRNVAKWRQIQRNGEAGR
jgi:UPF0755 protein